MLPQVADGPGNEGLAGAGAAALVRGRGTKPEMSALRAARRQVQACDEAPDDPRAVTNRALALPAVGALCG